jgi:nucleoside-diphosphate-sugar epimerase
MRLLVVGGSGFLGGYVLRGAARRGHQCVALARSPQAALIVEGYGAQPIAGDLDDPRRLDDAFVAARCEALICLASLGHGHGPGIVAAAEEAGIRRTVFVSTTAVMTTLHPPTKKVRLAAEQQIRDCLLDWTILRPTMIYGAPGDRNLSRLLTLLSRAAVLPVPGTGSCLHQPVHVADVATAVLAALDKRAAIGSLFVPVPLAPLLMLARGYELVSRHPRLRVEQLRRLAENKAFAIDDAIRDLGYAPRPFASGIADEARMLGLAA